MAMGEPAQPAASADRRKSTRKRTLKAAQIQTLDGKSTFDCVVRNLSLHGALLVLPSTVGVPAEFHLMMPSESRAIPCRVAWRDIKRLGVSFLTEGSDLNRYCGL